MRICSGPANLRLQAGQTQMVACTFIYFSHCLASCSACLRLACSSETSLGCGCCFLSSCSRFSLSCYIVMEGRAFSSSISRCLWRWQQLSYCPAFSPPLFRSLRTASQGRGLAKSSSALLREYITVTFCPLMRKLGSLASLQATVVSSGEKNSMKAKSLKAPVSLLRICLMSRTGAQASNISRRVLSSTSVIAGPRSIRLQFWADSSRRGRTAGCVLQLRRQAAVFSASQRQQRPRLAKFLQSHFSQYQSQARLRSTLRTGKYCTFILRPASSTSPFTCSITAMAASTLGYRRQSLSPCGSASSGTLVPMLMLRSVNKLSNWAAAYPTPSSIKVLVSSSLNLGCGLSSLDFSSLGLLERERSLLCCDSEGLITTIQCKRAV